MERNLTSRMWVFAAVACVLGLALNQANAAPVLVDDFAAGVDLNTVFGPTSALDDGAHAGVIGGYRDTSLVAATGAAAIIYSPVITNSLAFVAFSGSTGTFTSKYDGLGGAGLGANLTALGNDKVIVPIIDANGDGIVSVTIEDTGANLFKLTNAVVEGMSGVTLIYPLTHFSSNGVDVTKVRSITIELTTTKVASDFTIGAVQAIPEPASIGILGLGALVLLQRRRRLA